MRECYYCGKEAYWESPVNGVDLCNRNECHTQFIGNQSEPIDEENEN
jgi:hypothetical protein